MENLLVVDLYNTVIRSLSVHQDLSFNETPTGGLFGTINQLANLFNKYKPDFIMVCRDSPPYLRKKIYPEYKQNRKKDDETSQIFYEKINVSIRLVEELLACFNIPIWSEPGLEADDLIATVVLEYSNSIDQVIVASNDNDLFQLLDVANLSLLRKNQEYNFDSFKEEFPTITPLDWILVTAMSGTHNGVKGLNRIGLKTAIKIINDPIRLEKVYEENKTIIDTNMDLITLPYIHHRIETKDIPVPITPKLNETALVRYLDMYGIRYASHMVYAFSPYSTRRIMYG